MLSSKARSNPLTIIQEHQERVMAVLAEEEDSFSSMLTRGIKELNEHGLIVTITNDSTPSG